MPADTARPDHAALGERELMASLVATWNSCPFCVGAHSAIAAKVTPHEAVELTLADYRKAGLKPRLVATLGFLEKLTVSPDVISPADAQAALNAGVSRPALTDATAAAAIFNIITRYANALDFAIPTPAEFNKAGGMLLRRGYG